jgi:uncharacterized CHY-type Zn-finger protein
MNVILEQTLIDLLSRDSEKHSREIDRSARILDEIIERRQLRQKEKAIANGFSCWEEFEKHQTEKCRLEDEEAAKSLEQECALKGITVQQYLDEHPQRYSPRYLLPRCDCDGKYYIPESECLVT